LLGIGGTTTVTLTGVQPLTYTRSTSHNPALGELQAISSIHELKGITPNQNEAKYIIDWLSNVHGHFIWPDITDNAIVTTKTLTIGRGDNAPTLTHTGKQSGGSRNCVKLNVDGNEIYLCTSSSQSAKEIKKPGFILYVGTPSEAFREKIRVCLSFSLGVYLVHLGHSIFCKDWDLVSFKAISAYALDGRAFEIPSTPPAPLSMKYEWEIDRDILSRMVNSLYALWRLEFFILELGLLARHLCDAAYCCGSLRRGRGGVTTSVCKAQCNNLSDESSLSWALEHLKARGGGSPDGYADQRTNKEDT
jgi:hypothetical protein